MTPAPMPTGPWTGEADREDWATHGVACAIRRTPSLGHLCGYVGVPTGHPWHGVDLAYIHAEVHGGVTFATTAVPFGEPDGLWWVGFDCAHYGDLVPGALRDHGVYRDLAYVRAEVERLAEQAAAVSP